MPKLALKDLAHLNTLDPSGRVMNMMKQLETAINNMATQVNASPIGTPPQPNKIAAVVPKVLTAGVHQVSIQDNSPVTRGIIYHFEMSTTPDFVPGTVVLAQSGPSKTAIVPTGAGPIFWRAFSQYQTGDPSAPVYATGALDAGGGARVSPLSGTGSGTSSSVSPEGGVGFGVTPERLPRL